MTTARTFARAAALAALAATTAGCSWMSSINEPAQRTPGPYDLYKLGSVYDCAAIARPDMRENTTNEATPGFGCAHQSNLTVMVAEPADLQRPRAVTPADDAARKRVRDAYRDGGRTSVGPGAQGTSSLIK